MENQAITFPCKECGDNILYILPAPYSHIAECRTCGHPNDTPTQEQIINYNKE